MPSPCEDEFERDAVDAAGDARSKLPQPLVPLHRRALLLGCALLVLYAIALACLLSKRSLWLDEILDLSVARLTSLKSLIAYVRATPGAVPLGYFVQAASVHLLGFSAFSGRLPSALASIVSCVGIFILGRRLGLRSPLFACVVFAICPLQLRYSLEARSYALALAFSIWSSVLFLQMLKRPRDFHTDLAYLVCVIAGVYTQPFSLFVPLSHLLWSLATNDDRRRTSLRVALVILVASA